MEIGGVLSKVRGAEAKYAVSDKSLWREEMSVGEKKAIQEILLTKHL